MFFFLLVFLRVSYTVVVIVVVMTHRSSKCIFNRYKRVCVFKYKGLLIIVVIVIIIIVK